MGHAEFLIGGLVLAVAGLSGVARFLSVPYPIVLVVGGAVLGFVPGLPQVRLDPAVVLVVFLPPLLYGSSIFANINDFRADLHWLALNTIPLVIATMAAVALAAHALVPGLSWAAAFVLGAVVSPTDPLAAAAIMRRLDVPRRIVSAIEGEGLFNDATALVAYRVAVTAVVVGTFSLGHAARVMALTVQARVIRLEMRLRLSSCLPPDLRGRIGDLTLRQLTALRFASDAEIADLVRDVLAGKLANQREIKMRVKDWQGDFLRA